MPGLLALRAFIIEVVLKQHTSTHTKRMHILFTPPVALPRAGPMIVSEHVRVYIYIVLAEISCYNAEKPALLIDDPLTWWKDKRMAFLNLLLLARKYLRIVATSLPS